LFRGQNDGGRSSNRSSRWQPKLPLKTSQEKDRTMPHHSITSTSAETPIPPDDPDRS
jgi:hypothetical protein